ncbi:MAG: hypothetical protein IT514_12700, partial [Burkholderiales bacterium]|nr:hypothetical protein [Burkholderiales bacterium]
MSAENPAGPPDNVRPLPARAKRAAPGAPPPVRRSHQRLRLVELLLAV